MKRQKKSHFGTILLVLCVLVGLSLLLYPSLSNYWNNVYSTHAIAVYNEKTTELTESEYTEVWEEAQNYNAATRHGRENHFFSDSDRLLYENLLNIDGNGVMGYIEIPGIKVTLPIFHGTSDDVLQKGVGHMEWSSLPVGGKSTHCVLSGHRGLPSAKLFTDLNKLEIGDIFTLCILQEVLSYEVDQIMIVEPQDTEELTITEGEDYCTLITCTPYGINTHRLLVRGHRVENEEDHINVHITSEAVEIEPLIVAPLLALPLMIIMFIVLLASDKKKSSHAMENEENETNENTLS
ncbi:MAG: class C sortase [Lachnospiraceae bacterium]|nr:class C sortase [Lachnospiraceae bacterium]